MKRIFTIAILLSAALSSCTMRQLGHVFYGMPSTRVHRIQFEKENLNADIKFVYPDTSNDSYLKELRETYKLAELTRQAKTDKEKALILLGWTNQQWSHNGGNEPSKPDALTILKEVKDGKRYRCVEYGVVSTDAMLSVGLKARVLGLKTKDVETAKTGAGHVLAEVWLQEFSKWALVDGQFNIMPILNGIPLNAVEFQDAIVNKKPFELINSQGKVSDIARKSYLDFIPHYLYYFDISFDERRIAKKETKYTYNEKPKLMLVPSGNKNPVIFQQKYLINYCYYTNSIKDFYRAPNL